MSATTLANVLHSEPTRNRLRAILELDKQRTFTLQEISAEVSKLGLKPFEYYHIKKYVQNTELLFNELAMLELIADHLLDV